MANISPILKSQLEQNNNHDRVYRHLTKHANDVKPNEPKAKLIKENFAQSAVSAVKDTFQDGKNFFKAVKTGKLNDNNLGRINDLGMKAGALLIATYLASHAKTKTDSIMKFLGGGAFFASMALWPKLFINLPARLAHGFRIDHKYLSAQGDKKDLGLDNQFQPMDIFTDEEMMEMAKNAGIDPKDEFAKEKMQRKLQKTMLQNRTLWMATAGFATPLMTSIIGDNITPVVRNGVIKRGFNKVKRIVSDSDKLDKYLDNAKQYKVSVYDENLKKYVPVADKVDELLKSLGTGNPDKDFYQKLSALMSLDKANILFKDPDDIKTIEHFKSGDLAPVLKRMFEEDSFVTKESLVDAVSKLEKPRKGKIDLKAAISGANEVSATFTKEEAQEMLKEYNDTLSLIDIKKILASKNLTQTQIDNLINGLEPDKRIFVGHIQKYVSNTLNPLTSRFKAYIDLYNPVAGSKYESAYTGEFHETMKTLFDKLGIKRKDYDKLFNNEKLNGTPEQIASRMREQQEFLAKKMKKYVAKNPDYIKDFMGETADDILAALGEESPREKVEPLLKIVAKFIDAKNKANGNDEKIAEVINTLKNDLKECFGDDFYLITNDWEFNNFAQYITKDNRQWMEEIADRYPETVKYQKFLHRVLGIFPEKDVLADTLSSSGSVKRIEAFEGNVNTAITRALLGGGEDGSIGLSQNLKNFTNDKRIDLSAINLKAIIAANFETRLKNNEFETLSPSELQYLKTIVYNGSIGKLADPAMLNPQVKNHLLDVLFNDSFEQEKKVVPELSRVIARLRNLAKDDAKAKEDYLSSTSFAELIKKRGIEAFENKTWQKIFYPLAIGLVAVTLLAQPLFGKIDKEFSKKTKREEVHNGNK